MAPTWYVINQDIWKGSVMSRTATSNGMMVKSGAFGHCRWCCVFVRSVDEISCVEYQLCLSVVGVGKESFIISFHICTAATWATVSFKKVKPAIRFLAY